MAGERVSGVICVGVDPFFYFEYWAERPGVPPLIYEWDVEAISMGVRSPENWRSVTQTRTWVDQTGAYLLRCRSTGRGASNALTAVPKAP